MDNFSWSDSVQAVFGSCLSCMGQSPRHDSNNEHDNDNNATLSRSRLDELEGLLADSDDAETMSLHSNLGDRDRSRRKRRQRKGIKVFGYDLFGRPPIHLPDDENEDMSSSRRREQAPEAQRTRTISSSTLDSDASPLDASTIEELTAARAAESAAKEEEERRAKEERRQKRRERKELKRAALALAMSREGDFEGFQGSGGSAHGNIPSPFRTSTVDSSDISSPRVQEDFGPFEQSQVHENPDDDAIDGAADFGAESYTRPRPNGTSGSGSDSRSRTSASNSNPDSARYNHHYLSQQPIPSPHMLSNAPPSEMSTPPPKKKKSKRDKQSRLSVSTTSQSASLASPPPQQASFPFVAASEADHPGIRNWLYQSLRYRMAVSQVQGYLEL
ncbi:hypothetical protein QCA50_011879 [Cerrena zonata]|uniref:Uncharacterized protein n=1 Tax=Cerrena zonata TaxID=2478898 RepID=A0AAW0FTU2_9APHY